MENINGSLRKMEVMHGDYNPVDADNLGEVPEVAAVFGLFGIVNGEPVNCRYVGSADNLRQAVKELFERPEGEGFRRFMHGPWVTMLVYEPMEGSTGEEREEAGSRWRVQYSPGVGEFGEYPGYYDRE